MRKFLEMPVSFFFFVVVVFCFCFCFSGQIVVESGYYGTESPYHIISFKDCSFFIA